MEDSIKEVVLYPPILVAMIISFIATSVIIYHLTANSKIAVIFEKIVIHIMLMAMLYVIGFIQLSFNQFTIIGRNPLFYIASLSIYTIIFIILRKRVSGILTNFLMLLKQQILSIYISIIAFSAFWSFDPVHTLISAFSLLLVSIFAVYVGKKYNWQELTELLRWNFVFVAISSIVIALLVPALNSFKYKEGWSGAFNHPNSLGYAMALGSLLWLLNLLNNPKYRVRSLGLSIMMIAMLILSNTAGALVSFLISTIILLLIPLMRRLKLIQSITMFFCFLSIFSLVFLWLISNFNYIFNNFITLLGRDISFSGRVPLWHALIEKYIKHRPWLGYGYNSYWIHHDSPYSPAAPIWNSKVADWGTGNDYFPVTSHTLVLEIILTIGIIGLLIFALSFLINIIRTTKFISIDKSPDSTIPLLIFTYLIFSNISDVLLYTVDFYWFVYVIVTVRLQIELKNKHRAIRCYRNKPVL